jgi:3-oxoacyl-[acyl-carrier protein] reductase
VSGDPYRLDGQVALVTGASRGIGRACLMALAAAGARVVGTSTSAAGVSDLEQGIASAGLKGRGLVLDVSVDASVQSAIAAVEAQEGAIGILVNNAGITRDGLLMRMKPEEWQAVIDTNLSSVYRTSRAVLRGMIKARGGRIVNIASVVGQSGNPGQANYAAAKAGIIGFSKALALEVASRNITVNVVAPGFIDTDMTRALPETARGALLERIPLARLGTVEDIALAVRFLCSPAAGYITGATLAVNGGMYLA